MPISAIGTPRAAAITAETIGPQIRPWHGPMPQRVKAFSWLGPGAPSRTARRICPTDTSSQRQAIVSSSGGTRTDRPGHSVLAPADDDTIACRCEEVTVGQIRRAVRLGAPGPNQLKAFTRCGMGPCQGRICGPIVSAVIAEARRVPIAEIGTYRPRAPYKPITVGALAGMSAAK